MRGAAKPTRGFVGVLAWKTAFIWCRSPNEKEVEMLL